MYITTMHHLAVVSFAKVAKMAFFDKPLFDGNSVDIHMLTKMHNQNPRLKLGGHQILM